MRKTKQNAAPTGLIAGATGLIGTALLARMPAQERYTRIAVLARRPPEIDDARIDVHVRDFEALEALASEAPNAFAVTDIFCCLGTTMAKAGSKAAFERVDLHYVETLARLGAAAGAERFLLVSAVGAHPASPFYYNRIKGRAEAAVSRQGFKCVEIVRPSLLLGKRGEHRPGEALGQRVAPLVAPALIGAARRYRPIRADAVADRMLALAAREREGVHITHPSEPL